MRDRAVVDFIRDRVRAEIEANPSVRPYLGEGEAVDPEALAEKRARATEYQRRRRAELRRRAEAGR